MSCHPTSHLLAPLAALLLFFFTPRHSEGLSVLTGAASLALKDLNHGSLHLDVFDHHDDSSHQPYNFMVETDFCKLFDMGPFTHILLRHCQVDRTAPLNVKPASLHYKRIRERASFAKSVPSKQVTNVGVEGFQGDPNIPEKAINELGKGDGEGMNVGKKYYKLFPDMHRLGRRWPINQQRDRR